MANEHSMTAFVDESGDHNLNVGTPGVSNLFICAAVVLNDSDIDEANAVVIRRQKQYFGGSEMKSSHIGRNHQRRLEVLNALASIPFGYYATITDKSQLPKDSGFRFKRSFYKSMNRMLYERLLIGVCSLDIVADEHGGREFMESFQPYLKSKVLPSLWTKCTHEFRDSASTPLIQVADIIAGSLAYCFDPARDCGEYRDKFLNVLQHKESGVEIYPPRFQTIPNVLPTTPSEWDIRVRSICRNTIVAFIDKFRDDQREERQMQVAVLRHLFFLSEQEETDRKTCHSGRLLDYLMRLGFGGTDLRKLQQSVIGPLRDEGVIIAGDSTGYRLAMSVSDLDRYIQHDRSIVEPMLDRLLKAQVLLKTGTANNLDILV